MRKQLSTHYIGSIVSVHDCVSHFLDFFRLIKKQRLEKRFFYHDLYVMRCIGLTYIGHVQSILVSINNKSFLYSKIEALLA